MKKNRIRTMNGEIEKVRKLLLHYRSAMADYSSRIMVLLVAGLFFSTVAIPMVEAGNQIQIPLRWCAVQGSPAVTNPSSLGDPTTDMVLWRRHERASDRVWIPGGEITFRSGITAALRDQGRFPIINDPNPPASGGPGQLGDIVDPQINSTELNNARASCQAAWDALGTQFSTTLVGPIAINLRRFVDNNGNPTTLIGWGGFTNFQPAFATVCRDPTKFTAASGGYASVVDQTFTRGADPNDERLLAHELGHVLFLGHGNGLDDDNNGVYDDNTIGCDPAETNNNPATIMHPNINSATNTITTLQRGTARGIGRVYSGTQLDPPGTPINSDTITDQRVDTVHDVTDNSVDIETVRITENTVEGMTIISHSLFGIIPSSANNQYLVFADLDNNPATGGAPSTLGFSTGFQGAELVTRVVVNSTGGEFPQRIVTPTVWKFQGGAFVRVEEEPGIRADVQTPRGGETLLPLFDVVSIQMPNAVRGPRGTQIRIQAVAQQFTAGGQLDRLPNAPDNGSVNLVIVPPQFPTCTVTPAQVLQGATATVEASGLLSNHTAEVILGDQLVATGPIDDVGNTDVSFVVPSDARTGSRLVTVGANDTALTGDCTVEVLAAPPGALGSISGMKFNDLNGNGINEAEPGLDGWTITLTGPSGTISTVTSNGGKYKFEGLAASTYTVGEVLLPGWKQTAPIGGTYTVTISPGQIVTSKDFGNKKFSIFGMKFNDKNNNKKRDTGDEGLAGWHIRLIGVDTLTLTPVNREEITDANGNYGFMDVSPGIYQVFEVMQGPNWVPTTSVTVPITNLKAGESINVNFGNRRIP